MKKVVLKSQVPDLAKLEKKMSNIGMAFSPAVWQSERIFWPSDFRPGMNQPRLVLRTEVAQTDQPATYYLYLKRHIEDSGLDFVHMTTVGDYAEAIEIVKQMGYREAADVSRQRRTLQLDGHTVLYLDTVEGIDGVFLKLEVEMLEEAPVDAVRATLFETLSLLGLETFMMQTYAELLAGNTLQPYYLPKPV
jgi:predicted adenylyl cyclase CyaB